MDYKKKILEILDKCDTEYSKSAREMVENGGEKTPFQWFLMYQTLIEELVDATGQGSKEIDVEFGGKQYKFKNLEEMLGHLQKEGAAAKIKTQKQKPRTTCKKRS